MNLAILVAIAALWPSPGESQGQPKEVALSTDAIHLEAFESSGAFYVWDAATGRFQRVRVAD